ncbi:hypothetical protein [Chitinophaga flava]|uniref:Uncharacterized protein n=1 Tax=Chitinophaga flava TaxID=2259036 RepID=A0A365Y6W1_9BACT|nr:hypothetical protein [Chitinophaga flava]RBL93635.1 hypothetical protein DF182_14110 [Chitinophaga flava]
MTIAEHIHALRKHLAGLGLQPVPEVNDGSEPTVFRISFLNQHEMQRWKERQKQSETNHTIFQGTPEKNVP